MTTWTFSRLLSGGVAKRMARTIAALVVLAGFCALGAAPASAQANPCSGTYIFCDDFKGSVIDTAKWIKGNTNIGNQYPVRPGNVKLTTVNDNGRTITVVDARIFGDNHATQPRHGGVLITKQRYGGGRYEVRMKNLPGPNGCSCFWNYYSNEDEAGPTSIYTEIDIEMPAHVQSPPVWSTWRKILGFNTWADSPANEDATLIPILFI